MPTLATIVVHDEATGRSGYRYQFTPKHHGHGEDFDGQWMPSLTLAEEFAVFDAADQHDLSDDDGRLYGVQPNGSGSLRFLGTDHQQIAEFPFAREGEPWHGYPSYPLSEKGEKGRPAKDTCLPPRQ
jgi:hypothetical protein